MTGVFIDVPLEPEAVARLRTRSDLRLMIADPVSDEGLARPAEWLRDTQVLFCSTPPANLDVMNALEWVQLPSSGFEQLIPWNLPSRGVQASNARGVFDIPIAEWCIAMMVNLARDVRGLIRHQDQGIWDRSARFQQEIRGQVVGFWGYGGLARETARLCRALGLQVQVLTQQGLRPRTHVYCVPGSGDPEGLLPDKVFTSSQKEEFLRGLDFLILAMPLTPATRGIVGEPELRSLPSHAFLLNPARGPLVQEPALLRALAEHWIAGAALDTHFEYPLPPSHPLWRLPNVILTPHISGSTLSPHFLGRVWDLFTRNVDRFLSDQPLFNALTPEQLTPA